MKARAVPIIPLEDFGKSAFLTSRLLTQRFRLAVEKGFRKTSSVREYAELLHVTPAHLSESVRLETGSAAGDVIRRRLLLEAKRLLLHSELTVSEIAFDLGFEDSSYFSRFVRRGVGFSPVDFRNEIRKKYRIFTQ